MAEIRVATTTKVAALIAANALLLEQHGVSGGLHASRPAASAAGNFYFSTDTGVWARDNGATWDEVSGLSEAYIDAMIDALIATHASATATHGCTEVADVSDIAVDANLSSAAQAVVTAGACDTDGNLSAAAQAAITASHTAPTYDGVNDEVVFEI